MGWRSQVKCMRGKYKRGPKKYELGSLELKRTKAMALGIRVVTVVSVYLCCS